jgi:hypothetical protein
MVWMRDSARAAQLARERDMPVGLHLNFTLPFTDTHAAREVRSLQLELTERFDGSSWSEDNGVPRRRTH